MDTVDTWSIIEGAVDHFNRGEFAEAIDLFLQSIRASPSEPCMHFNLALALAKLGENEIALGALKHGLEIDPHDKQALKLLAMLYAITKKGDRGDRGATTYSWIGRFLKDKDFLANYDDGIVTSNIIGAILASPVNFSYGLVDEHGRFEKARRRGIQNAMQVGAYEGGLVMCYAHMSLPCLSGNDPEGIMGYILDNYEWLADDERGTGLLWLFERGRQRYEAAEYIDAARVLEGLVMVEPTNLAILFYCGKALRDSGDIGLVERSTEYYKRILQLNYENALGWYDLSLSYAILGDLQKELFCLQRAFDLGHSRQDIDRIAYLQGITAPVDPFG